jgi:hypothetical protein
MYFEKALSVIALLLPWAFFISNARFFHGRHKLLSAIASVVLVYAALLLQVHLIDVRLEKELYVFDLNGDGVFSGAEINPAQEAAMAAVVNDTGRAMAPITGAIFSVLYIAVALAIWEFASWLWSKYRGKHT